MDDMLREFAGAHPETKVCVVRPCIVLGPNVSNYIATLLMAQPVATLLDGQNAVVQFIHEDDLVRLLVACVDRGAAGAYNAVGDGTVDARALAAMQGKRPVPVPFGFAHGLVWAIHRLRLTPFAMPPGLLDFFRFSWIASGEKARRDLGVEPRYSSRECFEIILERKAEILASLKDAMAARGKR